jgi:hypothetical protein
MSANLWDGAADPAALVEMVRRLEVDVIALQEVAPGQAHALNAEMPYGTLGSVGDGHTVRIGMRRPGRVHIVPMPGRVIGFTHSTSLPSTTSESLGAACGPSISPRLMRPK